MKIETKHISIKTLRHSKTGLMVAVSADMVGLCVHGRNDEELMERIPVAIRALLEASGNEVVSVSAIAPHPNVPKDFVPVSPDYNAQVRHAA